MAVLSLLLKFLLYFTGIIGFLLVNRIFVTDPTLRKWLMQSFEGENGRASGKSISAFALVMCVVIGWFIAIHFGEKHLAPEYYYYGIIGLVISLFGVKAVTSIVGGKYSLASNGDGSIMATGNTAGAPPIVNPNPPPPENPFTEVIAQTPDQTKANPS